MCLLAGSQELAGRGLYYEGNAEIGLLMNLHSSPLRTGPLHREEESGM